MLLEKQLDAVFMGLGYIGLPTAAFAASKGLSVLGVDINPAVVETVLNRITVNPSICHSKHSVRNMRYPVEMLDLLSSGMTVLGIIKDYPAIEENDVLACLAFASQLTRVKSIHQLMA